MSNFTEAEWEYKFSRWVLPPSQTEQERCDNAARMVREALNANTALKEKSIDVFVQGSYRNQTNVRFESDVDICVLNTNNFFTDYSKVPGINNAHFNFISSSYTLDDFKKEVHLALIHKFGAVNVIKGDKAFNIKENSYRVTADVVPTFENKVYYREPSGILTYTSGTVLKSDKNKKQIINWPTQHFHNGQWKDIETEQNFKKKVRIIKNLRNEMISEGKDSAKKIASFLLESLIFNCPNSVLMEENNYDSMRKIIVYLFLNTQTDHLVSKMVEVNGIKLLFSEDQNWNREIVNIFLGDAYMYVGF